jgi:3-dehydroquinate synthase II
VWSDEPRGEPAAFCFPLITSVMGSSHFKGLTVKEAWVHLDDFSKEMVTTALEGGADALVLPPGCQNRVKALGRIMTVAPDGDLEPGRDVMFERLSSPADESRIARLLALSPVVLELPEMNEDIESPAPAGSARGWEVIPLENLVASGGRLLVPARTAEEVTLALAILEKGVAGVVIHPRSPGHLRVLLDLVKRSSEKVPLQTAVIERIEPVGLGDRVCVDTCTLMGEGEGLLVGNSSGFLFHVQAEAKPNPYVAPRPFRVNAGPVHAYARMPRGRTRYLCELAAGDAVLVVNAKGETQESTVGRIKIERRPLLLVEAAVPGKTGTILLQNAETIRLSAPAGEARSIVDLKAGDSILVAVEAEGRHFGLKVDETIREQ